MSKITKSIIVKTVFNGEHMYEDAPEEIKFLRELHPHIFFVSANIEVTNSTRELEFFMVKRVIDDYCKEFLTGNSGRSCETMAESIINLLHKKYGKRNCTVTVYEDNQNAGRVKYEI